MKIGEYLGKLREEQIARTRVYSTWPNKIYASRRVAELSGPEFFERKKKGELEETSQE